MFLGHGKEDGDQIIRRKPVTILCNSVPEKDTVLLAKA